MLCHFIQPDLNTWEVGRTLRQLENHSAVCCGFLTLLSCSPNFPSVQISLYKMEKRFIFLKYNVYWLYLYTTFGVAELPLVYILLIFLVEFVRETGRQFHRCRVFHNIYQYQPKLAQYSCIKLIEDEFNSGVYIMPALTTTYFISAKLQYYNRFCFHTQLI